jgi:hypothetical protein
MSGYSSDTLCVAEVVEFDSSTLTILALLSEALQMVTAGPYGVDWIVVLFMPLAYLSYRIEHNILISRRVFVPDSQKPDL